MATANEPSLRNRPNKKKKKTDIIILYEILFRIIVVLTCIQKYNTDEIHIILRLQSYCTRMYIIISQTLLVH